jgi:hypothetical protein
MLLLRSDAPEVPSLERLLLFRDDGEGSGP